MIDTAFPLCNGHVVDLLDVRATDIDFAAIAEHLAKINRYSGGTRDMVWSVAAHSLVAAQLGMVIDGDPLLAAYLLCHDMHEAFFGDVTTPKKRAITAICLRLGAEAQKVGQALNEMIERADAAIHQAAGLKWPADPEVAARIKYFDRMALAIEWRALMPGPPPAECADIEIPLNWALAYCEQWQYWCRELIDRCHDYLPGFPREK